VVQYVEFESKSFEAQFFTSLSLGSRVESPKPGAFIAKHYGSTACNSCTSPTLRMYIELFQFFDDPFPASFSIV
jgi:hypothetical protein